MRCFRCCILAVHNHLACVYGLEHFGNKKQKEKYLRVWPAGETRAFLLSEPGSRFRMLLAAYNAVDKGDHYVINGVKNWITSADKGSGLPLLIAQTKTRVLKPKASMHYC